MKQNMLNHWCEFLSPTDIQAIHDSSMRLLSEVGMQFPDDKALAIFKKHGVKTNGLAVYLSEDQVMKSIASVPSQFTICARNADRDVIVGDGVPVFAPGLGAPFLAGPEVGKRSATMADYRDLVRLTQALPNQDMNGHLMVMPGDIPSDTAHLEMLHAGMVHSDKAFIGSTDGAAGAKNTVEMARILFGGELTRPVTIGVINPLSPMGANPDMIAALMIYAQAGQTLPNAPLIFGGGPQGQTLYRGDPPPK
ncbi:MAG: trimethylamine methyltransferase family protein, partial [Chloroflexi bacterium]|nr:trimethylamine methyltransferase family protein [Chloroflexota bacterium]